MRRDAVGVGAEDVDGSGAGALPCRIGPRVVARLNDREGDQSDEEGEQRSTDQRDLEDGRTALPVMAPHEHGTVEGGPATSTHTVADTVTGLPVMAPISGVNNARLPLAVTFKGWPAASPPEVGLHGVTSGLNEKEKDPDPEFDPLQVAFDGSAHALPTTLCSWPGWLAA